MFRARNATLHKDRATLIGLILLYLTCLAPASAWLQLNTFQRRDDYWLRNNPGSIGGRSVKEIGNLRDCVPNSRSDEGRTVLDAVTIWNRPEFGGPTVSAVAFYNSPLCDEPVEADGQPVVPMWIMILNQHRLPGLHVGNLKKLNAGFQWMSFKAFNVAEAQSSGGLLEKYQGDLSGTMFGKARSTELKWVRFNDAIKMPPTGDWSKLTDTRAINAYMRDVTEDVLLRGVKTDQQKATTKAVLDSLLRYILPGGPGQAPIEVPDQQLGRRPGPGENDNVNIYKLAPMEFYRIGADANLRYTNVSPEQLSRNTNPQNYQYPGHISRQIGIDAPLNGAIPRPLPGRESAQSGSFYYGSNPRMMVSNPRVPTHPGGTMRPWVPQSSAENSGDNANPRKLDILIHEREILRSFQRADDKYEWLKSLWVNYGTFGNTFNIDSNIWNAYQQGKLPTLGPGDKLVWPKKNQPATIPNDTEDEDEEGEDEDEEDDESDEAIAERQAQNENSDVSSIVSEEPSQERVVEPPRKVQSDRMLIEEEKIPVPPVRGFIEAQRARIQEVPQGSRNARTGEYTPQPQRYLDARYAPSGQISSQQSRTPSEIANEEVIPIPNQARVIKLDFGLRKPPQPAEEIQAEEQVPPREQINTSVPNNPDSVSQLGPIQQLSPITLQQRPAGVESGIPESVSPASQQSRPQTVSFKSIGTQIRPDVFRIGGQEISEAIRKQADLEVPPNPNSMIPEQQTSQRIPQEYFQMQPPVRNNLGSVRNARQEDRQELPPSTGSRNRSPNEAGRIQVPNPNRGSGRVAAELIEQLRQTSAKPVAGKPQAQPQENVQIAQENLQTIPAEIPIERNEVVDVPVSNPQQANIVEEPVALPLSEIITEQVPPLLVDQPLEVQGDMEIEPLLESIPTVIERPQDLRPANNVQVNINQNAPGQPRTRIYNNHPVLRGIPVTFRRNQNGAIYPIPEPPTWTTEDEIYAHWKPGKNSWIKPERVTRYGRDYAIDTADLDPAPPPLKEGEIIPIYQEGFNEDEWNPPDPFDDDDEPELVPGARRLVRPVMRNIFRNQDRPHMDWDEFYARQRGWAPAAGGIFGPREFWGPDTNAMREFYDVARSEAVRNGAFGWHDYADRVRNFLSRPPLKPEDAHLGEGVPNLTKDLGEKEVPLRKWVDEFVKPEDLDKFKNPDDYDIDWDDVEKTLVTKKIKPNTSSIW
ncbi:hypothetical protein TWF694_005099 [Orbilia ellipsospora]|uniref:Uncharacterized protein n=1 Tax=Orbilia ellipsospora TaxID=2528407 RepID=A0AAV9WVV7_9PEZI